MNTTTLRLLLTLIAGTLVGSIFVIGKLLMNQGLSPVAASFFQVIGAASVVVTLVAVRGQRLPTDPAALRFFAIAALIAVSASAVVGNWVLARIPAGIFTVVVTLSPLFTSLFQALVQRKLPPRNALIGTGLGLLGVSLVLLPRAQSVDSEQGLALMVALAVPVLLAAGNVYRSRYWPTGMDAPTSTAGTMALQALMLVPLFFSGDAMASLPHAVALWPLVLLMIVITVAANVSAAALQRVADSVAYSQIGYVIALTGVVAGAWLFGESLGWTLLPALVLVFSGVLLANRPAKPRATEHVGAMAEAA
jgi:drug/metabolite transporter (DMT)-like permease